MLNLHRCVDPKSQQKLFFVEFMTWDRFLSAMLYRSDNQVTWDILSQMDCLIGGIDMTISYL